MAEFNQVYARAAYYDIAFRRDILPEVIFISDEYRRLNGRPGPTPGINLTRVL